MRLLLSPWGKLEEVSRRWRLSLLCDYTSNRTRLLLDIILQSVRKKGRDFRISHNLWTTKKAMAFSGDRLQSNRY